MLYWNWNIIIIKFRNYNPNKGAAQIEWVDSMCFRIIGVIVMFLNINRTKNQLLGTIAKTKGMPFSERRYLGRLIRIFTVSQYLGFILNYFLNDSVFVKSQILGHIEGI